MGAVRGFEMIKQPGKTVDDFGGVIAQAEARYFFDAAALPDPAVAAETTSMSHDDLFTKITGMLPAQRQNLFFSATMPPEIGALAAELLGQAAVEDDPAVMLDAFLEHKAGSAILAKALDGVREAQKGTSDALKSAANDLAVSTGGLEDYELAASNAAN